mgnify:FL=1
MKFYFQFIIIYRETYNIILPEPGKYATGILFLDKITNTQVEEKFASIANENGLRIICWRTVPKNSSVIGEMARTQEPLMRQVFVESVETDIDDREFQRKVCIRIAFEEQN